MISSNKKTIQQTAQMATKALGEGSVAVETLADSDEVYGVNVKLINPRLLRQDKPSSISFSYDKDLGYFIDIDQTTLEYGCDKEKFLSQSRLYIHAISAGEMRIVQKRILGIIPLRKKLKIG